MPEPGINDPDFNRPTTDRKKFRRRSKARVTLPGEYAGFRLKDGRPLGAVLGEGFFGPAGGVGEPMAKLLREQSREDNSPLARMIRNDPRFAPRREPAGGTVDRDGAMPGPPAVRIRPPDPPGPTVSVLPLADGRPRQFTDPGHSPFVQANAGEPARPAISGLADNPAAGIPNAVSLDEEGFGKLLAAIDEAPRLSPLQRRQLAYIARGVRRGDLAGENIPTALRMTGAWARPPNLPDSSQPEDTAGETAWKLIENTPSMFKQVWGGLMMSRAESDGPMDRSEEDFLKNKLNSPNEAWRKLAEKRLANRERERESSFAYGAELYARATRDLMDNAPNVDPESLKGYGYDIGAAFVQMAPAVGATLASKGRAPAGMAVLGTQVYGQKYGEARASGRTDPEARQDATFYALSEAIPERIPLGILMKQGGKFLPRLTRTMAAEGVQEIFTEILQIGYEAGELGEDMTWGEAWGRIKRSGIIGSFVGGGMSTATHPFVAGAPKPDLNVSVAGTGMDWDLISEYEKGSRHKKFKNSNLSAAQPGQEGRSVFGNTDPNSSKRIVQPINDAGQMLAIARENVEPLSRQLTELVVDLPGVEFVGARSKENAPRLEQKLGTGRRHDTMGDYLGGRIVIDDDLMLNETVRVLARRYKNIELDNFMVEPRPSGYRAIHMQIVLDNGMTAEIQIMPRSVYKVYLREHAESYTPGRGSRQTLSETEKINLLKRKDEFREEYAKAWQEFVGEEGHGGDE